jgi:hypothetical protein
VTDAEAAGAPVRVRSSQQPRPSRGVAPPGGRLSKSSRGSWMSLGGDNSSRRLRSRTRAWYAAGYCASPPRSRSISIALVRLSFEIRNDSASDRRPSTLPSPGRRRFYIGPWYRLPTAGPRLSDRHSGTSMRTLSRSNVHISSGQIKRVGRLEDDRRDHTDHAAGSSRRYTRCPSGTRGRRR